MNIDPYTAGSLIQVFHLTVSIAVWFYVGRIGTVSALVGVVLILMISWIIFDGCFLTLYANEFFWEAGVEPHCTRWGLVTWLKDNVIHPLEPYPIGRGGPYCSMYDWLSARYGPYYGYTHFVLDTMAYMCGELARRHHARHVVANKKADDLVLETSEGITE